MNKTSEHRGIISAAILSLSLLCVSAAYGESRSYDLPPFDRIDVSAGIKLVATVGEDQQVEVFTENGDFHDFSIEVRNGELRTKREQSRLSWHKSRQDYEVRVSIENLERIEASSGSYGKITNLSLIHI